MSKLKEYRVTCNVRGEVEITVRAESEEAAEQAAEAAIEGGEARIDWDGEGRGVVRFESAADIQAVEEEKEE
jgi:hypothetical protein